MLTHPQSGSGEIRMVEIMRWAKRFLPEAAHVELPPQQLMKTITIHGPKSANLDSKRYKSGIMPSNAGSRFPSAMQCMAA